MEGLEMNGEYNVAAKPASFSRKPAVSGTAAFLAGVLLASFAAIADTSHAQSQTADIPLSTEDIILLERYPDASSLRRTQEGQTGLTGLHELAQGGTLGLCSPDVAGQLAPSDLGIADNKGRRVADIWIASGQVPFANPAMKKLLFDYSDNLPAEDQLALAFVAVEHNVLGAVSLSNLEPSHLVRPAVFLVPADPSGKTARETGTNLLLDAQRFGQLDERMKILAAALTDEQKLEAAMVAEEYGGMDLLVEIFGEDEMKALQERLKQLPPGERAPLMPAEPPREYDI